MAAVKAAKWIYYRYFVDSQGPGVFRGVGCPGGLVLRQSCAIGLYTNASEVFTDT